MAESLCLGNFDVLETLGAGSFSTVIKARPKLRPELSVVLKETRGMQNSGVTRANVGREVEMLKAARGCAYVSQFYAAFIEGDSHYMVMEFVPGGDLLKTVQQCMAAKTPPDEPTLWRYLYELGQGVAFLHRRGIVHRDIKCQNIMLSSQGHIKLIDLGLAAAIPPGQCLTERCGTPFYMAVEMINKQPYDQRVDVWSSGCVFYMLAQLRPAFNGQNLQNLCRSIIEDVPAPLCAKRFSPHLSALILRMLDKRRELRPTMEEVLAHPVFAHYPHFPPEAFSAASSAVALQPPPPSYAYQPQQPLSPPGAVDYAQARAAAYGSGATGAGEVVTTSAAKEAEAKADEKRQQRELAALMRAQRAAQLHQHQQQQQQLHSGGGVGGHGTAASAPVALPLGPGSVVAAAGEQTVVDVDDIIQPVLPDLALQDSEQLTDVPYAAEGRLISVTPTTHLLTPTSAAAAAAILFAEGPVVPPPPLLPLHLPFAATGREEGGGMMGAAGASTPPRPRAGVGRGHSMPPLSAPAAPTADGEKEDDDDAFTVPLPPAVPGALAHPPPLTRAASSPATPHATHVGGTQSPPAPPTWAGRSPLRPQRPTPQQQQPLLPSSPRVRQLIAAHTSDGWAAGGASAAASPHSSFGSGSHKRALVELGPDGGSAFAASSYGSVASFDGDGSEPALQPAPAAATASVSVGAGTPKRSRRVAEQQQQYQQYQHRMVEELMAGRGGHEGGAQERTHSSPGRMMGGRFRLHAYGHGHNKDGEPVVVSAAAAAPPTGVDACLSSTSLAGHQQQQQQQQQQLQACFAALALPSPSSSSSASAAKRRGGAGATALEDGASLAACSLLSDSDAGLELGSPGGWAAAASLGRTHSAPSTPLRRSPRRRKGQRAQGGAGAALFA